MAHMPSKPKVRYVLWLPCSREGEFEFLCSTQKHWTTSLKTIKKELESSIEEAQQSAVAAVDGPEEWRQLTREEALEELGGQPKIFKLIIEELQ